MNLTTPASFGDHLVFVDESGDHGLVNVNQDFPLFALAFCVFAKTDYVERVTPALRRLKLATFGHDLVVLHEHDLRKKGGAFAMMSREPRTAFMDALSEVIEAAPFTLAAAILILMRSATFRSLRQPETGPFLNVSRLPADAEVEAARTPRAKMRIAGWRRW